MVHGRIIGRRGYGRTISQREIWKNRRPAVTWRNHQPAGRAETGNQAWWPDSVYRHENSGQKQRRWTKE